MNRNRTLALAGSTLLLLALMPLSASAGEGTFDSAGVPIHFDDMGGDGEPVVLVHSFTSTSDMWTNAGFGPSDELRFIALDVRGHGQSGKPEGDDAYGIEMAEDVVRLLDHLGIEDAHVAGYSMGAEIALKLATKHPERVRSVVAGGSGWSPAEAYEVYSYAAMSLDTATTLGESVQAMMPPEVTDEQIAFLLGTMERHGIDIENDGPAALASVARSMDELIDLTELEVAGIDVPVLGIVSENDSERLYIERMDGVVPDFTLELIPAGPTGDPSMDHLSATLDPTFHDSIVEFLVDQS